MKNRIKQLFVEPLLVAVLGWVVVAQVPAQTFTTLHSFTATDTSGTNLDGTFPLGGVILSGNTLYGTAREGGSGGEGTVFAMNTDGTGFRTLHAFTAFTATNQPGFVGLNTDGALPSATLALSGNTLYGAAAFGGTSGWGTVFAINTDGTGFTNLYVFSGSDGIAPDVLILSGGTLYGITFEGGSTGNLALGTVFAINTDGTGFTTLYDFTGANDGLLPNGMTLGGTTLYGVTGSGGTPQGQSNGTVFQLNTDGTGFTTLYSFSPTAPSDGANPRGGLVSSGSTLYGTASSGGTGTAGTVFKLNTDGTGFAVLHNFTGNGVNLVTNSDGAVPYGLTLSGSTLYGTALWGGSAANGTVFKLNTDGSGFTVLHDFSAGSTNSDGARPFLGLLLSGNTLYGTTEVGGSAGNGTVFSISLAVTSPQLSITPAGGSVVLSWPTNATGFTLQSTTNLASPAVWTAVSPGPVVINGQNIVTNPISGTQQFYRLSQ